MIGLTVANLTFPPLTLDEHLAVANALGLAGLDLIDAVTTTASFIGIPYADARSRRNAAHGIRDSYRSAGLPVTDFYPVPNSWDGSHPMLNSPDEHERLAAREEFEWMLDFAAEVGAQGLTLYSGPDLESDGDAFSRLADELTWRVGRGASVGVPISIEPTVGSMTRHPEPTRRLLDAVPGLTLTLDHSHFICEGHTDVECEPLLDRTRHLHARGASPGHLQQPLSSSTIDYGRVTDALLGSGFDGTICLEFVPPAPFPVEPVDVWNETLALRNLLVEHLSIGNTST